MKRWATAALVLVAALVAGWLVVRATSPGWYGRIVYPLEHGEAIRAAAAKNDLDPALIAAIIFEESRFNERSSSPKGAIGLMQVLPSTALEISRKTGGDAFVVGDLHDPRINVLYGSYYLRTLLDYYGGSTVKAVAAYNAGIGNVDEWVGRARATGEGFAVSDIPFAETREYVKDVRRLTKVYGRAYGEELSPGAP